MLTTTWLQVFDATRYSDITKPDPSVHQVGDRTGYPFAADITLPCIDGS